MDDGETTPSRIERLIGHPAVRSTYASLVTHVVVLIGLALLMIPGRAAVRPQPIVIAMADAPADDVLPGSAGGGTEIVALLAEEPTEEALAIVAVDPPVVPLVEPITVATPDDFGAVADAVESAPEPPAVPARNASLSANRDGPQAARPTLY